MYLHPSTKTPALIIVTVRLALNHKIRSSGPLLVFCTFQQSNQDECPDIIRTNYSCTGLQ